MQRDTDGTRSRWSGKLERAREARPAMMYAAARKKPLTAAARAAARADRELGPYETRYDIRHGYGVERMIIQP
jgi:hypothetical protein